MDKLLTKLVRLSKPVKVTNSNKDTLAYNVTELITAVKTFIFRAFGQHDPVIPYSKALNAQQALMLL
jgi:hypothetical protein